MSSNLIKKNLPNRIHLIDLNKMYFVTTWQKAQSSTLQAFGNSASDIMYAGVAWPLKWRWYMQLKPQHTWEVRHLELQSTGMMTPYAFGQAHEGVKHNRWNMNQEMKWNNEMKYDRQWNGMEWNEHDMKCNGIWMIGWNEHGMEWKWIDKWNRWVSTNAWMNWHDIWNGMDLDKIGFTWKPIKLFYDIIYWLWLLIMMLMIWSFAILKN